MRCEDARIHYYAYLSNAADVPEAVKEHIGQCSACQRQLELLQETLEQGESEEPSLRPKALELHYQLLGRWVSCEMVKPFLPLLLLGEVGVTHSTPVTAHVDRCEACQGALAEITALRLSSPALLKAAYYLANGHHQADLDDSVRAVLQKIKYAADSDILTRMQVDRDQVAGGMLLSDSAKIDVEHRSRVQPLRQRQVKSRRISAWVTGGVAAAVLFMILLVLPTGDVKALDVEQLYTTLSNVQNVHIQKFDGGEELENIWISEGLGVYLFQQGDTAVLVNKRSGNVFQHHQGTVQLISREADMELERPWGLLPFEHISKLPASYEWEYISDAVLENGMTVRVYEWTWTETLNNQVNITRIWRGYLDTRSYLPYRIECLDKIGDTPAALTMEMKVRYPSDAECREVFERYGFGELLTYGAQGEMLIKFPSSSNTCSTAEDFCLSTWPSAKTALNVSAE